MEIEPEELRDIILGKQEYRRCPQCDGRGRVFYLNSSDEAVSFKVYDESDDKDQDDQCDNCNGVGYLKKPI